MLLILDEPYFWLVRDTALAIVTGAAASLLGEFIVKRRWLRRRPESLAHRVEILSKSLADATALIDTISNEIAARTRLVEKLRQDEARYDELLHLKKSEVDAIVQVLRGELEEQGRKSFWSGVGVNFVFFLLGVIVSLVISIASASLRNETVPGSQSSPSIVGTTQR